MNPATDSAKRWQWRAEWLLQVALETVIGLLPGTLVHRLGALAGGLAWHLVPGRRTIVLRNLRIALADTHEPDAIRRIARESFRMTGANLFSAGHSARLSPARLRQILEIENPELLDEAFACGKGLVLLLAHMGNWELLSRIVHLFPPGSRTGALYRPLNNPLLDQRTLDRRQADGTRMFSKRDNLHAITGFLREGGTIGILADQRVGPAGECNVFFGRATRSSPLPALLARRTNSQVLALALVTTAPGRWKAVVSKVASPVSTAACMAAIESNMRLSMTDVFWMQERWKSFASPQHPPAKWLGSSTGTAPKPLRALVWPAPSHPDWQPPADWFHPGIRQEIALEEGVPVPPWITPARVHHQASPAMLPIMDSADPLPFDYILSPAPCQALRRQAKRLAIPLVTLPVNG